MKAEVVDFADRATVLDRVDVAVSATGAQGFTIAASDMPDRELMLIDLSLPRDIDEACAKKDGIELVNIDRLSNDLTSGEVHEGPHSQARDIVREELDSYSSAQRVRDVAPAVSALRKHAADLVHCEAARLEQKHPELTEAQLKDVNRALKRVVDKLLHEPTVRAKQLAATSGTVSHETALQQLFGLNLEDTGSEGVAVNAAELPTEI